MPPRRDASKTMSQTDDEHQEDHSERNGEATGRKGLRIRKRVDYNEDRSISADQGVPVKKIVKEGKSTQKKNKGQKQKEGSSDRDSSPVNQETGSDSLQNKNKSGSASIAKKPSRKEEKAGSADLNETFAVKNKTKTQGKGNKRNLNVLEESPQENEAGSASLDETFVVQNETKTKEKSKHGKTVLSDEPPETKKTKTDKEKLNKVDTDYSAITFSNDKTTIDGEKWNLKITSWNVDGLRAWLKKDGAIFLEHENPDILCLQETKCSEGKLPPEANFKGYHAYWAAAEKEGYSGVGLFSKVEPISVKYGMGVGELDAEGRLITAEYEKFYLVTTYVPNAGKNLVTLPKRLSWDAEFRKYVKQLNSEKPVIVCGDMNVSHQEIDLANPKTNTKNAGFTKEEREGMTELLSQGFVDTFRHLYPKEEGAYTFWTYLRGARSRNVGWRLDYFIVSETVIDQVCDHVIRNLVLGSDHCPITLMFHNK